MCFFEGYVTTQRENGLMVMWSSVVATMLNGERRSKHFVTVYVRFMFLGSESNADSVSEKESC